MVEGLKRILQTRGATEVPDGASEAEVEALFLAELRSRRERLARWMQTIQEEVRRQAGVPRGRAHSRQHCRRRTARP
jgi:hypothetical protein